MARTKKPCPLCKDPGLRDTDDVCSSCRRTHERLLKLETEIAERGELEAYSIPVDQWPARAPFGFRVSPDLYKALSQMLLAIAPLASNQRNVSSHAIPWYQNHYTKLQPRLMTPAAAETIKAFFKLMHAEFERCASEGIQSGKGLLLQFASGGITADDLNQAGIKDGRL